MNNKTPQKTPDADSSKLNRSASNLSQSSALYGLDKLPEPVTKSSSKKPVDKSYFASTVSASGEHTKQRSNTLYAPNLAQSLVNSSSPKTKEARSSMGLDRSMSGENLSAKLGDKRLPDPSLFTEDKSEWIQSDNCIVCKKRFDKLKLIYTHHCRLCKNSVCGDCSGKKIEDKRVCDICYTRAYDVRGQERRSQTMQSKKDLRKKYHDDKKNFRNEANELEKNIFDLRAQLGEEEENQEKAIEALKKELTKYKDIIQKKTENNEKLKENLQANKALYFDKEKEFNELDRKLKILNKEIQHKEELVSAKEGELKQLNDQKLIYETSPSFLDVTQAKRNALGSSQYYSSVASSTGGPQRTGSITK